MPAKSKIEFQETSASATDFLHELNDPSLLKSCTLPARATLELRRQQVTRLEENIRLLTVKREEFNRRMDDYIENLKALIRGIQRRIESEVQKSRNRPSAQEDHATVVRCLGCDSQRIFKAMQIIFARESEESISLPTQVYVLDGPTLKKGHFQCVSCGASSLVIRTL